MLFFLGKNDLNTLDSLYTITRTALSEIERKMMYFTETAWALPDMCEVNEVFEQDLGWPQKIAAQARSAPRYPGRTPSAKQR